MSLETEEALVTKFMSLKVVRRLHVGVESDEGGAFVPTDIGTSPLLGGEEYRSLSWAVADVQISVCGSFCLVAANKNTAGAANAKSARISATVPHFARLLLLDLRNGYDVQVFPSLFKRIDAAKFCCKSTQKAFVAAQDVQSSICLWDFASNSVNQVYLLPAPVISPRGLCAHPLKDMFLVSCKTSFVYLFKGDSPKPQYQLCCSNSHPTASFDDEGLIFACARGAQQLHLINCDSAEPQEFAVFKLGHVLPVESSVCALVFSPNGDNLLVLTDKHELLVLNAYGGEVLQMCKLGGALGVGSVCTPAYDATSTCFFMVGVHGELHIYKSHVSEAVLPSSTVGEGSLKPVATLRDFVAILGEQAANFMICASPKHALIAIGSGPFVDISMPSQK